VDKKDISDVAVVTALVLDGADDSEIKGRTGVEDYIIRVVREVLEEDGRCTPREVLSRAVTIDFGGRTSGMDLKTPAGRRVSNVFISMFIEKVRSGFGGKRYTKYLGPESTEGFAKAFIEDGHSLWFVTENGLTTKDLPIASLLQALDVVAIEYDVLPTQMFALYLIGYDEFISRVLEECGL